MHRGATVGCVRLWPLVGSTSLSFFFFRSGENIRKAHIFFLCFCMYFRRCSSASSTSVETSGVVLLQPLRSLKSVANRKKVVLVSGLGSWSLMAEKQFVFRSGRYAIGGILEAHRDELLDDAVFQILTGQYLCCLSSVHLDPDARMLAIPSWVCR